jgi:hypothetical protein
MVIPDNADLTSACEDSASAERGWEKCHAEMKNAENDKAAAERVRAAGLASDGERPLKSLDGQLQNSPY